MQPIGGGGYTSEEVLAVLRGPARQWSFRYELLDSQNNKLADLDNVLGCEVSQNFLAIIKRTATFLIAAQGNINFQADRLRPWVRLKMPDGGFREWPQGVFLPSSPTRYTDTTGTVYREVDAYDQLLVFEDDKVVDRFSVAEDSVVTDEVSTILGNITKNITPSASTLPVDREWPPGTSKLAIINDLLRLINYESLSFDALGRAVVRPYKATHLRPSEFTYRDTVDSVIFPEMERERDLFDIPNRWVLVVSEPDLDPIVGVYTNDNLASPTSTVARDRVIVDFREQEEAVDQLTLDARAERLAFEASQVYEAVEFESGLMPFHDTNDVYTLGYTRLGFDAKFSEHRWSMPFEAGGRMKHRARRVVAV